MIEASAAVAAAQLLALYAEPLRHRPRLTHGREALPGAIHAFRFAQDRFPDEVVRETSAAERAKLREASDFFIRQVCLWEGASHYQVLGVPVDAPRQAIKEHYHAVMGLLHPDRQAKGSRRWPSSAAARVNKAYSILSDEALRRDYDARQGDATGPVPGMAAHETPAASPHAAIHRRGGAAPFRYARTALVGTAAVASLFVLNVWWAGNPSPEYATLQSATPLEASWRWMRESLSSTRLPRFMGTGERPAPEAPRAEEVPVAVRKPAVESPFVPVSHERAVAPPEADAGIRPVAQPQPLAAEDPVAAPREEAARPPRLAQQAPVPPPAPVEEAGIADLELLVAHLVSHYEAGDVDRLVGLFDPASLSAADAVGLRRDFERFFGATTSRQLSLRSISWDSPSRPVRARGEAVLQATYADRSERLERVVPVDMGIVWRGGQPRIARLSLFPHE